MDTVISFVFGSTLWWVLSKACIHHQGFFFLWLAARWDRLSLGGRNTALELQF